MHVDSADLFLLSFSLSAWIQMEQVSDDELDHGAEEDSDKEDQDLDKMFGAWLGELDKLTQVKTHTHRLSQVEKKRQKKKGAVSIATLTLLILSLCPYPSNSPPTFHFILCRSVCRSV